MKKIALLLLLSIQALAASNTSTVVGSKVGTNVYCIGGCSGGVGGGSSFSLVDKSAFSFGTDSLVPGGGVYQDALPSLTAGTTGVFRLTANRGLHVNLRDASGAELDPRLVRALTAADVVTAQQGGAPWTVSGSGTFASRLTDGTNSITKLFDNDTGAGTEFNIGVSLRKSAPGGSVELGTSSDPMRTDPVGTTPQPISASALPLPTGASTETTLSALNTKIPASPAQDRTAAASPSATRLSDGTSFYKPTTPTDTQPISAAALPLPAGASTETTLSGIKTGTDKIPASPSQEHATAVSPHSMRLSDGAAFYKATTPSDTQPVSAAALPLPSGASTETTLSAMNTKIPASPAAEHTTAASPNACRMSDGAAFFDPRLVTIQNSSINVDATGTKTTASVMPSGGVGFLGWLSAIVEKLSGTLTVSVSNTPAVTVSSGTVTNNDGGTKTTAATMPAGGVGLTGWLSAIYDRLAGTTNTVANAFITKEAPPTTATYYFSNGATVFTPVATATNMVQIRGSASKKVRIQSLVICPTATAAGTQTVFLRKQSTADTGGTSAAVTLAPTNSSQAAATGTVVQYSANPTTPGTLVGTLIAKKVFFQIAAGTATMPGCVDLIDRMDTGELFTLNGTAESFSINNNGAALASGYSIPAYYGYFSEE